MAGNLQADNNGDIYVEFDYNNIIVVDPNKTINSFGEVQERLVDHENLVMYANLEADVLPRTKLAVGASTGNRITTISVAKMNFLKPTNNDYLSVGYYDEFTGKNSRSFEGANQPKVLINKTTSGDIAYKDTVNDLSDVVDNGLLGITSINITTNSSFVPSVSIELEDVQGRALFQLGDSSPYAAFFNLPYCQFYLTLKGYYGQAVRYQLNLETFNARFNSFSGNYQVTLKFKGYKFNILNEISMGHLLATPHMYSQTYTTTNNLITNVNDSSIVTRTTEKGYEKIKEVYSEYKSKGLVPSDLPEITLVQLMNKLENFETFIVNSYPKSNLEPLTNIRIYKNDLKLYYEKIRNGVNSWFNKYLDPNPLVLYSGDLVYVYKQGLNAQQIQLAVNELNKDINEFNQKLASNTTLGSKGASPIKNNITYNMLYYDKIQNEVDWSATTIQQFGTITQINYDNLTRKYNNVSDSYIFESKSYANAIRFNSEISRMDAEANKKLSEYESKISTDLANRLQDSATGLGFRPTVRNILGVIMASAEAFIRLMDDVHTSAWNLRNDDIRQNVILNNPSSAPSSDKLNYFEGSDEPVYPWPQFFVETPEDKKGRFQLKYIGDPSVVNLTQGSLYSKWPEVEFVEEYMKGLLQRFNPPQYPEPLDNQSFTNQININAIEFPETNISYINKSEIKFFYEIWERQFMTANYSGLNRALRNEVDKLIELVVESETNNIVNSLGVSSPYITYKLKNYGLSNQNYIDFLKNISNSGSGRAYQDFSRDFFVTPYIKNLTDDSFSILSILDFGKIPEYSPKSDALLNFVKSSNNIPLIVDTIPFTNSSWVSKNMAGVKQNLGNFVYNTNKTYKVFGPRNIISNFTDIYNFTENRPVTNFSYLTTNNPISQITTLSDFYLNRDYNLFVPTEGVCEYKSPTNTLIFKKTTSMLNTPYFINAIQYGVNNQRADNPYPYIQAAYLFLNSLPLASLKEKYKTYENDVTVDLDYISSVFKKYGAIHKMPYAWVLKIGSIWYRYKKYIESNVDILDPIWDNFNYTDNYSPIEKKKDQTYNFTYNNESISITLESITNDSNNMNVGFYPKVITDFNYFYNGFDLYSTYTNNEIQNSINLGLKLYNYTKSNFEVYSNDGKLTTEKTWSVIIPSINLTNNPDTCNITNNIPNSTYYISPSFGSNINQAIYECATNIEGTQPIEVVPFLNNQQIYNGSVRLLWGAPNYGYFDANSIVRPNPDEYLNSFTNDDLQTPFKLLDSKKYSKIEEVFSVFDKSILDKFEVEFLNFCKPSTDIKSQPNLSGFNNTSVDVNLVNRNFQGLFKSLMVLETNTVSSDSEYFNNVFDTQINNFYNGIQGFMKYDVLLRYGNPTNYKRRVFDSYISYGTVNDTVVDPIEFKPYQQNTLPSKNGNISLIQSKINNQKAWKTLELEVGFSTIDGVVYTNTGSTITDFFIDNNIEFSVENIQLLSPIIKMYATQKNNNPNLSVQDFKTQLQNYLSANNDLRGVFLTQLLKTLNEKLPESFEIVPEKTINSIVDGQQSKVELWEIFKALNDKWIAGSDFSDKTLFEDMLFLDRASRNIGDTILLDIFDLKNTFNTKSLNSAMSVFTFISSILIKNNFTVMNLPAYVNFYNIQNIDGTTTPKPEGSLDFANKMWGTYLNVDYRESSPKMVCFFVGKPSNYLDLPKSNYRFRDDGFDLRRASENPLIEDQSGKKDWALSNKCVGFNVDIGTRNQNVFYSFSVDQNSGTATSESINTLLDMVNQANGRNTSTQNNSLYNFYKNRSYNCTISSMGNALIQPTMYFNLRHVPMFNGPYLILSVDHSIQPGSFMTTFTGVRQSIFDLPSIDNFLQQVNQNLLTRLTELLKIKTDFTPIPVTTDNKKSSDVVQKADSTKAPQNSCSSNLAEFYQIQRYDRAYTSKDAVETQITPQEFSNLLKSKFPSNPVLRIVIYSISYLRTFKKTNNTDIGNFIGYDNNFATITLDKQFNSNNVYILKTYSCLNLKQNTPYPIANFENIDKYLDFMSSILTPNISRIVNDIGLQKYYVCHWPISNTISESYYDSNINEFNNVRETLISAVNSAKNVKLVSDEDIKNFETTITSGNNLTTIVITECPPPVINSFYPLSGSTGTIVQINGINLLNTTEILLNNISVDFNTVIIFNDNTIRFSVPQTTQTKPINCNIIVKSKFGSTTSNLTFTYN